MIEYSKLPIAKNNECLDLVWKVFSELEAPLFEAEAGVSYKKIIDETRYWMLKNAITLNAKPIFLKRESWTFEIRF